MSFSSTELFILFQLADCLYVLLFSPFFLIFAEPNSTLIAANSEWHIKALKSILIYLLSYAYSNYDGLEDLEGLEPCRTNIVYPRHLGLKNESFAY